jgi:serine/threonine protein kinase
VRRTFKLTKFYCIFLGTTFVVEEKYEFLKQIGHGAYGVVCSANNKKTNQKVAIKKVATQEHEKEHETLY